MCRYPANPAFIGCLCPAMLVGLTGESGGGGVLGGKHMSFFVIIH